MKFKAPSSSPIRRERPISKMVDSRRFKSFVFKRIRLAARCVLYSTASCMIHEAQKVTPTASGDGPCITSMDTPVWQAGEIGRLMCIVSRSTKYKQMKNKARYQKLDQFGAKKAICCCLLAQLGWYAHLMANCLGSSPAAIV